MNCIYLLVNWRWPRARRLHYRAQLRPPRGCGSWTASARPAAPWLAGLGAALVAWPAAALPLITTVTTTLFGIGAGLGTASGVKALKRGE